jgi:hypothetical protein
MRASMRLYAAIGGTEPSEHVMFTFRLEGSKLGGPLPAH